MNIAFSIFKYVLNITIRNEYILINWNYIEIRAVKKILGLRTSKGKVDKKKPR